MFFSFEAMMSVCSGLFYVLGSSALLNVLGFLGFFWFLFLINVVLILFCFSFTFSSRRSTGLCCVFMWMQH